MAQLFDVQISQTLYIGMNDKYPSHLLPNGVFPSIDNAFVDNNRIFKRGGTSSLFTSPASQIFLGASPYEPNGGTKLQIFCLNGASNAQLYKWTGSGAPSAIGSANLAKDAYMYFTQAGGKIFGFNGTDEVDFDGTTVTKNRSGLPQGSFSFWFHNYLFVGGVTSAPNRLYWSNLGDPTVFSGGDYVDINANDGDQLTGLSSLNDELIVFKLNSTWSISGWSGTTFAVTTAAGQNTQNKAAGVGTMSHGSIVSVGKDLYYLSFLGNIPHFRSFNQTAFSKTLDKGVISDELETTMSGLNKTALARCSGIFDGRYIFWTVPNSSSTTNSLILTLNPGKSFSTVYGPMQTWVKFTGVTAGTFYSSTISGRSRIYCTDSTAVGRAYLFNDTSVYSDNGTAIVMDVRTRDFMADPARQASYIYLYQKYKSGSIGTLKINARIDQAVDYTLQQSLMMAGNSPGLGPTGTFTLGTSQLGGSAVVENRTSFLHLTGHLLGVQFKESTANACELYDAQIFGNKKGLRAS